MPVESEDSRRAEVIHVVAVLESEKPEPRCSIPRCTDKPEGICPMCDEHTCKSHGKHPYHFGIQLYGAAKPEPAPAFIHTKKGKRS